jgi:hypothetical protein
MWASKREEKNERVADKVRKYSSPKIYAKQKVIKKVSIPWLKK